jgi:hypothetical protein
MKKLIVLAALAISTLTFGQERHHEKREHHKDGKMEMMKDFTPEQIATLKTKKMALHLDLTKAQQDKIQSLNLTSVKERKVKMTERKEKHQNEKVKLSSEEKYNKMNSRLDKQIALKKEMKSILNDKQFQKWEASKKYEIKKRKRHAMRK